jgi:hypothetical protein
MKLHHEVIIVLCLVSTAAAAESITQQLDPVSGIVERFGIAAGLLLYFVVRDYYRSKDDRAEHNNTDRKLDDLNTYIRDKLEALIIESKDELRESREARERLEHKLKDRKDG